jgi:acetyl-CoA acetyltransferase
MPEPVIVDAVRTPIGRAFKGSLAGLRPDEMGAFVVDALLERNEEVDPSLIEEVYCGVGLPQGLQGFNMGRIIALLSERLPLETNGSTLEKLSQLEPAFKEGGKVTAGNSCPLNDGAAAVLVMSDTKAEELGLKPRARIIASATAANEPEYMGVAPIDAIRKVLERAGMSIEDVDTVELNEAFAAQVIPIMAECDIPLEKMNPHGGAIALGHPFGMTGARIMTTLLNGLETDDKTIGLETMCVAGGQGQAIIVERLN